jgi:hypothetical protein
MPVTLNASTSSGLIATSDTSGDVAIQANGTTKLTVSSTGVNIGQYNPGTSLITSGTAVSASSTSVDFTGIPSWVKRVTIMLAGVSTNGSSSMRFQLGDSGGIETTGYNSSSCYLGSATGAADSTTGFDSFGDTNAVASRSGLFTFALLGSNTWVMNGSYRYAQSAFGIIIYGDKTLSATLDRVRITTQNGTDTFDAGTINILYE